MTKNDTKIKWNKIMMDEIENKINQENDKKSNNKKNKDQI
jgi:hypothetical protein